MRTGVYDPAVALLAHGGHRVLCDDQSARDVRSMDPVEVIRLEVGDRDAVGFARIVDERIDTAKVSKSRLHDLLAVSGVLDCPATRDG